MKKILALIILSVCALAAQAKIVAKSTGQVGSVLLMDEKCEGLEKGQKLVVISHKAVKLGEGCWLKVAGDIYLVSPQLGQAVVPEDSFEWVANETTRPSQI